LVRRDSQGGRNVIDPCTVYFLCTSACCAFSMYRAQSAFIGTASSSRCLSLLCPPLHSCTYINFGMKVFARSQVKLFLCPSLAALPFVLCWSPEPCPRDVYLCGARSASSKATTASSGIGSEVRVHLPTVSNPWLGFNLSEPV